VEGGIWPTQKFRRGENMCLVVNVDELVYAVMRSVRWRRAVAVTQHALISALHIVIIDFELNFSNFYINFYYCCRQLNNMH